MVNAFSCNTFKNLTTEPVLAITSLPLKVNSWPLPQGYYLQKAILEGWGKKAGRKGKQSDVLSSNIILLLYLSEEDLFSRISSSDTRITASITCILLSEQRNKILTMYIKTRRNPDRKQSFCLSVIIPHSRTKDCKIPLHPSLLT